MLRGSLVLQLPRRRRQERHMLVRQQPQTVYTWHAQAVRAAHIRTALPPESDVRFA